MPPFLNLGIAHCHEGQIAEALPYLEQAWRLDPQRSACAAALGYVCYKLDELGLAWHWYAKALQLEPEQDDYKKSLRCIGELISAAGQ